eukprot:5383921-Prymnesium_polylepis.1
MPQHGADHIGGVQLAATGGHALTSSRCEHPPAARGACGSPCSEWACADARASLRTGLWR